MTTIMPSWDEWNGSMTKEQREYETYKVLVSLDDRVNNLPLRCVDQIKDCELKLVKKEEIVDMRKDLVINKRLVNILLTGFLIVIIAYISTKIIQEII